MKYVSNFINFIKLCFIGIFVLTLFELYNAPIKHAQKEREEHQKYKEILERLSKE